MPMQHHPVQHSQERHQRKHKVQNIFIITISLSQIMINHNYHPYYIAIIITSPPSKSPLLSNRKMFIIVLQFLSSVTFGNGCSHRTRSQPQLKKILFRWNASMFSSSKYKESAKHTEHTRRSLKTPLDYWPTITCLEHHSKLLQCLI